MKKIYLQINIVANNEVRNIAFAKGINRSINLGNVEKILAMMKVKGYRKAEQIQVIKAEDVIKTGDISLVDINGQDIKPEDAAKYFLVLDGQHRVIAAALYNEWAAENGKETIDVPAIEVELQGNETIAEYINEINITKKEWTTPDYVRGAANINPDGYPISTLNLIFCGNNNAISKSDFSLLCSGKDEKGKKVKKPIIPAYNMEIGNKFIQICKDKGFDDKDIAKRHLIQQFNNIKTTAGDANEAIKIFQTITQNDKAAMFNTHGNLDESLVMEQFKKIRERNDNPIIIPVEGTGTASTDADEDIPYLEAEEVR